MNHLSSTSSSALRSAIQSYITPLILTFSPRLTKIPYRIHQGSQTIITLYDQLGKRISVLHEAYQSSGNHVFCWKHADMMQGTYFIHIRAAHRQWVRRVVVK
ncbi:MAG: T9SS type A sorting domain-containing protein [Bacteroidota bacterium]